MQLGRSGMYKKGDGGVECNVVRKCAGHALGPTKQEHGCKVQSCGRSGEPAQQRQCKKRRDDVERRRGGWGLGQWRHTHGAFLTD